MINNPIEPSAAMRNIASFAYESFTAFCEAGFSEERATAMVMHIISNMMRQSATDTQT